MPKGIDWTQQGAGLGTLPAEYRTPQALQAYYGPLIPKWNDFVRLSNSAGGDLIANSRARQAAGKDVDPIRGLVNYGVSQKWFPNEAAANAAIAAKGINAFTPEQLAAGRDWSLREQERGNVQQDTGLGGLVMKSAPAVMGFITGNPMAGLLAGTAQGGISSGGNPLGMLSGALSGYSGGSFGQSVAANGLIGAVQNAVSGLKNLVTHPIDTIGGAVSGAVDAGANFIKDPLGALSSAGSGGGFVNPAGLGTGGTGLGLDAAQLFNPASMGGFAGATGGLGALGSNALQAALAASLYTPASIVAPTIINPLVEKALGPLPESIAAPPPPAPAPAPAPNPNAVPGNNTGITTPTGGGLTGSGQPSPIDVGIAGNTATTPVDLSNSSLATATGTVTPAPGVTPLPTGEVIPGTNITVGGPEPVAPVPDVAVPSYGNQIPGGSTGVTTPTGGGLTGSGQLNPAEVGILNNTASNGIDLGWSPLATGTGTVTPMPGVTPWPTGETIPGTNINVGSPQTTGPLTEAPVLTPEPAPEPAPITTPSLDPANVIAGTAPLSAGANLINTAGDIANAVLTVTDAVGMLTPQEETGMLSSGGGMGMLGGGEFGVSPYKKNPYPKSRPRKSKGINSQIVAKA